MTAFVQQPTDILQNNLTTALRLSRGHVQVKSNDWKHQRFESMLKLYRFIRILDTLIKCSFLLHCTFSLDGIHLSVDYFIMHKWKMPLGFLFMLLTY